MRVMRPPPVGTRPRHEPRRPRGRLATSLWLDALSSNALGTHSTRGSAELMETSTTRRPDLTGLDRSVGGAVVDRPLELGEPPATATPPQLDDLGGDGDRGLLRGAGAEVQADRRAEAAELLVGQTGLAQPVEALLVPAP